MIILATAAVSVIIPTIMTLCGYGVAAWQWWFVVVVCSLLCGFLAYRGVK
jgi:amino acid transporter